MLPADEALELNVIDLIAFILLTVLKSTYDVVICGAVLCGLALLIAAGAAAAPLIAGADRLGRTGL